MMNNLYYAIILFLIIGISLKKISKFNFEMKMNESSSGWACRNMMGWIGPYIFSGQAQAR